MEVGAAVPTTNPRAGWNLPRHQAGYTWGMHTLLSGLAQVLLETALNMVAEAVVGAVSEQDNQLAPNPSAQPGTLDYELEQLRKLLLEYELKIEVRRPARDYLLRALKNFEGGASELVMQHIRQRLSDLIHDGQFKHGDIVVVDCVDGVMRVTPGR